MATLHFPSFAEIRAAWSGKIRRRDWGIISIILLALIVRLVLVPQGLPLLLHEDEPIYFDHALHVGQGDFDLHYFKKPSFFIYLYAAFYFVLYLYTPYLRWSSFEQVFWHDPTIVAIVGRSITVAFAVASVWLLYRIGKRGLSTAVGLGAAFLLAVDATHLKISPIVISDIPALFFILLAAWFALGVSERGRWKDYLLCGVSVALAMSFKYNVFSVMFLVAAHFGRYLETRSTGQWKAALTDKRFWMALLVIPTVFFLLNPYTLINFQSFYSDLMYEKRHMLTRQTAPEHDYVKWFVSFDDIFFKILPKAMGFVLYLSGLLGAALMFWKARHRAVVLLSFPFLFLLVVCQFQLINAKYLLPIFPFFYLAAVYFVREALAWARLKWFSDSDQKIWHVAYIVLVTVLAFQILKESAEHTRMGVRQDTRVQARDYLYKLLSKGQTVMAEPNTFALISIYYRPHLQIATWQGEEKEGLKQPFDRMIQPEAGLSALTQYQPDYVLLYFKAHRVSQGNYEMVLNPPEYYQSLSEHYEFRALFSPNPVPLTDEQLSSFFNNKGFAGLYAEIQDSEGKRDRPGPLLLLMQKKKFTQP